MIFIKKGDKPLTPQQLEKRSQKYVTRAFPNQNREESIRKNDGLFSGFMRAYSQDHAVNVANNTFNNKLSAYKQAVSRLEQYVLADGRLEVKEMQPTGEEVFNEETGEMEAVMKEVVVQTAIEPLEPTIEQTVYSDDMEAEPTIEVVENPLITQDNTEREAAQAVIDVTPDEVKEYLYKP